jgi:hypothetical protein
VLRCTTDIATVRRHEVNKRGTGRPLIPVCRNRSVVLSAAWSGPAGRGMGPLRLVCAREAVWLEADADSDWPSCRGIGTS